MEEQFLISKEEKKEYLKLRDNFQKERSEMLKLCYDERKNVNRVLGYLVGFASCVILYLLYGVIIT